MATFSGSLTPVAEGRRWAGRPWRAGPLGRCSGRAGIDASMLNADMAGDHGQVGQVHDIGRAGGVFGDAEGIEDARPRRIRVNLGRRVELVLGDAGDFADHR